MPLPRTVARMNKVVTNRLLIRLADRPPFAALHHVGRRSGRRYRIPINALRTDDGFVFALTYGPESDWVKNVVAAGRAELDHGGERIVLEAPRLIAMPEARDVLPLAVRAFLTILRVEHFLRMDVA